MSKQSSRHARILGGVLASALLAALLLPGVAFAVDGKDLADEISGNCNNPESEGSQTQCSINQANPSGTQEVEVYGGPAANYNETDQELEQKQINVQVGKAEVENRAEMEDIGGKATLVIKSGDVDVQGNQIDLDLSGTKQIAKADPKGIIYQDIHTGDAKTEVEGDTESEGGYAGAKQESESKIIADGDLSADHNQIGGDGGDQEGKNASFGGSNVAVGKQRGGDAEGDHVAVAVAANGKSEAESLAASLGLVVTKPAEDNYTPTDATATDRKEPSTITKAEADADSKAINKPEAEAKAEANGNTSSGGYFRLDQDQKAGDGGDVYSGPAGNGGAGTLTQNNNQLTGDPNSQAWGAAYGGDASSSAVGHLVTGGVTGGNEASASMNGGLANNELKLDIDQKGDAWGRSGDVTNNGGYATAPVYATIDQRSSASNCQEQKPEQEGSNKSFSPQKATSGDQYVNPSQTVKTDEQKASGSNSRRTNVEVEIEHSLNGNFNREKPN